METSLSSTDAYASLKIRDFKWFVAARFLFTFSTQMQSVVVGWQIYQLTHSALSLGFIGLAEVVPFFGITLFAGHIADIVHRKKIILISNIVYFACAVILLFISTSLDIVLSVHGAFPIYIIIFITGLARGFMTPAQTAFAAQLVPRGLFGNASTWSSLAWQTAEVTGPAAGGLIYGFAGVGSAYSVVAIMSAAGFLFFTLITNMPVPEHSSRESVMKSIRGGLKFVFSRQIILSALTLDMFAVFFGGAVSVLPIFADQILHTGAKGLGFLRAAPALGEILMSVYQAHHPFFEKAGRNLLICVAGFGLSMILFAVSKNFYLSLSLLLLSGLFDNVSVIIRATIIQIFTPDEMRGRVSSVNGIFLGSSNELGSFESGVAATLMGLVPSVIFGGTMTLLVVAALRKLAPKLKSLTM